MKKLYPDSTANPQSFFLTDNDSRFHLVDGGSGSLSQDNSTKVFTITNPGPKPTLQIYTTDGYRSSTLETNHGKAASKGFMMTNKDWKNVECTVYVRVGESNTSSSSILWSARGGALTNKSNGNCEACGYQGYLAFSGSSKFAKMEHAGSVNNTVQKGVTSDLEGRWVGFKFCCFDTGNSKVQLEVHIDEDESNSWRKVNSVVDTGTWSNQGARCGGSAGQVLTFGGPVVSFIIGDATDFEFKKLSVREIAAQGVFNEGGSNSGGGQQNGGTGSTGSGSSGGSTNNGTGGVSRCTSTNSNTKSNVQTNTKSNSGNDDEDEEEDEDESGSRENSNPTNTSTNNNSNTTGGGGNVDKFGVQSAYARGAIKYDWKENFRDDGKRFDFTGLGSSFASCELIGYFRHDNSLDDEVAGKMGGGNHSGNSKPRCYVLGIGTEDGAVRYRLEENHPSTGGGKSGPGSGQGGGIGFIGRWVGYRFVKRNQSNGVLLEIWQDQGSNGGNTPANQWKKIMSHVDTEKNWKNPPSDHQETIRIDEESDLQWKWISLREIRDGDSTTAPSNPGNDSGPNSGGGDAGGVPSSCSCDTNSPGSGSGSGNGDDMCDSDGDGVADTPGSGGGAQPEPPPIETITSDFTVLYNIAVDVTDSCTFGNPLESLPYEEVYKTDPDPFQYQDLGYLAKSGNSAVGLIVANTESELYDKIPRKITFKAIKRTVDGSLATCSGNLYCRVRNTSDNKLKYQFGTAVNVATIDVNDQELTFTQDDNKNILKVGDMILLEYLDNSADDTKCIKVKHTEKDKADGVNTYLVYRKTTGYVFSDRDKDMACYIYT